MYRNKSQAGKENNVQKMMVGQEKKLSVVCVAS